MRRLVLLRHGESMWNAEGRIQGHACAGLSAEGWRQARACARTLSEVHRGAALVTSDLQRAVETGDPIARELGATARIEPLLRERSFGSWEGRLRSEVETDDAGRWQRWLAGEDVVEEVGGESAVTLARRAAAVFAELLAGTAEGGTTIAVTHGGTIWHGVHELLDLDPPVLGGVTNASTTHLIAVRGGTVLLDRWNDDSVART